MKKYGLSIIVCILYSIVSIFLFYKNFVYKELLQRNRIENNRNKDKIESIKEDYLFHYTIDNMNLEKDLMIVDQSESYSKISDLLDKGNKLIILHNSNGCTPCIENVITPLMSDFNGDDYGNIIFLTTVKKSREILIFKNTYNYPGQIFRVSPESLPLPLKNSKGTVLFMINNTLNPFCVFQANKITPEITKSYLATIHSRFF